MAEVAGDVVVQAAIPKAVDSAVPASNRLDVSFMPFIPQNHPNGIALRFCGATFFDLQRNSIMIWPK
jgi:hypothetical protein